MSASPIPSPGPTPAPPRPARPRWWPAAAVAVTLGVAALVWLWGVPYWETRTHWRAAQEAAEDRDFAAARGHLEHCLAAWPDDPAAHFALARVLRRSGQPEAAEEALGRAARLGHPPAGVELERALGRTQSGDVRAAEAIPAAAVGPGDDRLVREALAAGLLHGHALDRAYRVTDKWVADRPDDWQARLWHARVLEQGLQLELAADAYAEAVRLRPGNAETGRGLGEVLYRLGRYADAAPHFEAVLRANPADAAARLGLARAQRGYLPPATAAETLRPLTEAPDPPAAVCLLAGQLALDQDRAEDAAGWLRRALAAAPFDRDANLALGQALHRLGRTDEAAKFAEKAEAIGRDHKRMEQITKAVAETPGDVELRYEAGTILARLGQDAGAAQWLVSALAINPGHRPTREALAACADRLGNPRLAEYARRALGTTGP